MTRPRRDEPRRVLRGLSANDRARPAKDVLAAVPWDCERQKATLTAADFLSQMVE
jgi:hypothetical protein